jgi:TRAP-type C4-dicarboxylate transport system permease large subunit
MKVVHMREVIGTVTPSVDVALYVVSNIVKTSFERRSLAIVPWR